MIWELEGQVDESLRLVQACKWVDEVGEVCPANWKKGQQGINTTKASEYFKNMDISNKLFFYAYKSYLLSYHIITIFNRIMYIPHSVFIRHQMMILRLWVYWPVYISTKLPQFPSLWHQRGARFDPNKLAANEFAADEGFGSGRRDWILVRRADTS